MLRGALWGAVLLSTVSAHAQTPSSGTLAAPASAAVSKQVWPELSAPGPAQADGLKDAALIVAIERYAFMPKVRGATTNARDWYLYLTKSRGIATHRVRLLEDSDATREQIEDAAREAASRVQPGGTLWFVFIGHGAPNMAGEGGLLVGVDTQRTAISLASRAVAEKRIVDLLEAGPQARTLAVIDACFSGRTATGRPLVEGLQPLTVVTRPAVPRALVFFAARGDEVAGPLPGARRPAFSYLTLGAMRGWADENRDGTVTAQEVADYSSAMLAALVTDRHQTPEFVGGEPSTVVSQGAVEPGPDAARLMIAIRALPAISDDEEDREAELARRAETERLAAEIAAKTAAERQQERARDEAAREQAIAAELQRKETARRRAARAAGFSFLALGLAAGATSVALWYAAEGARSDLYARQFTNAENIQVQIDYAASLYRGSGASWVAAAVCGIVAIPTLVRGWWTPRRPERTGPRTAARELLARGEGLELIPTGGTLQP